MDNNKQKTLLRLYYSALDESFSSFMKGDSPTAAKYFKKLREFTDISKEISIELSFKFAFGRNLYTHAAGSYGSARSNLYTGNFNEAKEHLLKTITILNKIGVLDQSLARLTFFAEELIPLELKYSEIFKANSLILLEGYLKSFLATLKNKEWARELLDSRKVCKEINISVSKNLHKKVFFKMNNLDFMFVIIARFKCASFLYDVINSKQVDFSIIDRLRGMLRNQGLASHYREEIAAIEKFVTGFRWFSAYNDSDDLKRIMKKDKVELEIELLENLKLPHKQDDKTSLTISEIKNIKKFMQVISHVSDGTMQIDKSVRKGVGVESGEEKAELKKPEEEKAEYKIPKEIEINFSKDANYIKIDGKEIPITKKQEFFLLEELLNKKIVHWSDGFILFGSWQDRSPARPVNQFWRVVSELNKIVGFRLVVSKKKYHLAFAPNIKIRSTILEANELCKEAKKETRTDKAIDKLKTAISLYPMSITTWELLIDIIQKNPNQKLEEDLISASEVFVKRERDLDAAIKRVQAEGDDKEWKGIWKEAWLYISKMSFELKEVRRYKIIVDKLRGEEKVNTNEVNCYSLVELIREIKKREISDYGKDIKSMSLFKDPIIMDCLKTVVNTVIQKARDGNIFNVERNDVIGITSSCFWILIKERDFTYKDTSSFKSYLKTSLLKMVLDQLRHEE